MKKLLLLILLFSSALFAQPNPQSKKVTEKFFSNPDVEINTPAFAKEKGFTNYEELMAFIEEKVADHPNLISYRFIGESQKGKKIPILTLNNSSRANTKIRVWMQGGLHGNEPASTEGLLHLINQLLEDPEHQNLLNNIDLRIVPMANIDGYIKQDRYAANGLDLNRDQTKLMAPESVILKEAFNKFNPEVAVDFHEYRPYRRDFARMSEWGITSAFDVMFLFTGNLNVPQELRQFTEEEFVNPAKKRMDQLGFRYHDYMSTRDYHGETHWHLGALNPRSSATNFALSNCVSTLIEVRGVALGRSAYKRRVFTTYSIAHSFLQSAQAKAQEVAAVLARTEKALPKTVAVKTTRTLRSEEISVIDIGTNELMKMDILIHDALLSEPTLERKRPTAYIILPGNEAAVAKLKTLGLTVQELNTEQSIEVESYKIIKYRQAHFKYEGAYTQEVETELITKKLSFPKGSFVINLDQKRSNLSAAVLEPEAPSSFIYFEVIETELGEELPIYRYLNKKKLAGLK